MYRFVVLRLSTLSLVTPPSSPPHPPECKSSYSAFSPADFRRGCSHPAYSLYITLFHTSSAPSAGIMGVSGFLLFYTALFVPVQVRTTLAPFNIVPLLSTWLSASEGSQPNRSGFTAVSQQIYPPPHWIRDFGILLRKKIFCSNPRTWRDFSATY